MTPLLLVAAFAASLAVPQSRHWLHKIWAAPAPRYCNEQRECCLKPKDCAILGMLPADRR